MALRTITIWFVQADILLREVHQLTVGTRTDGSEFIVRRDRHGKAKRFTLDDPHTIFFTPEGGPKAVLTPTRGPAFDDCSHAHDDR